MVVEEEGLTEEAQEAEDDDEGLRDRDTGADVHA